MEQVPEIPLVVSDKVQGLQKTKDAVTFLTKLGCYADVQRVSRN